MGRLDLQGVGAFLSMTTIQTDSNSEAPRPNLYDKLSNPNVNCGHARAKRSRLSVANWPTSAA
jgi:hypothetical protein